MGCRIHPAGDPRRGTCHGERIDPVHQERRRPDEPPPLRLLVGVDDSDRRLKIGDPGQLRGLTQYLTGDGLVWAVRHNQQFNPHTLDCPTRRQ